MMATKSAIPPALLAVTGVLPLSRTIFLWQSVVSALVIMAVSVAVAWLSCPSEEDAKTQADFGIEYKPLTVTVPAPEKPADRLEHAWPLSFSVGLLAVAYVVLQVARKGGLAALDLNLFNFAFLAVGLLLHARPLSFLSAVASAVPATAGVLIQFPFYGGVFGLISHTVLAARLEHLFTALSTRGSFPLLVAVYSAVLGLFVPSGGAKWVIEAPYVMAAANAFHVNLGWTVQIYNAAEALPNLLNPFWMLPLMGILSVRARELAGYAVLQLLFHVPLVLALCWLFARTLPYLPPHP
jgi:short-chain fatty acids transporter